MLRDEFDRLVKLFEEGVEGKPINLNDIFSQSLQFFEHLKVQIASGTSDEKKEAMEMMTQLYTHMMEETKKISERSGLSEEQLIAYADNPANFTPDQWRAIQESKDKISRAGSDLAKVIYEQGPLKAPVEQGKDTKKPPGGGKKHKRSQWMRS